MKQSTVKFTLLTALILFGITATVFSQQETIKESFDKVENLKLDIAVGDISLTKSTSGKVELEGKYDKEKLELRITFSGNNLSVVEKMKNKNRGKDNGMISHYTLAVPDHLNIRLNAGTGDVRISGVASEMDANAGTGDFDISQLNGEAKLNCGTGDIKLQNAEGKFFLNSGTGNVTIRYSSGELNANSGTGDVEMEKVSGTIAANSGTGDVNASQVTPGGEASFNSGTGDVKLVLTGPVTRDMSVNSGTGNAVLDMNGQSFNGTLVMSCDKKHGSISAPFGFDKEETKDRTLKKYKNFGDSGVELKVSTGSGKAKVVE